MIWNYRKLPVIKMDSPAPTLGEGRENLRVSSPSTGLAFAGTAIGLAFTALVGFAGGEVGTTGIRVASESDGLSATAGIGSTSSETVFLANEDWAPVSDLHRDLDEQTSRQLSAVLYAFEEDFRCLAEK